MNVICGRSSCKKKTKQSVWESVCLPAGGVIAKTTLLVFSRKGKYSLNSSAAAKASFWQDVVPGRQTHCVINIQWVTSLNASLSFDVWHEKCYIPSQHIISQAFTEKLEIHCEVLFSAQFLSAMKWMSTSKWGPFRSDFKVISVQRKKGEKGHLKFLFQPLFSQFSIFIYFFLQKRLQWLMRRRCRRLMSPPQDRVSLIKMLLGPWCWR